MKSQVEIFNLENVKENADGYFLLEDEQEGLLVKGETTYIYANGQGQWIHISPHHKEWTFKVQYSKNINIKNIPRKIVDAFERAMCDQNKYEGGYKEAISVLSIK